MNVKEMSTNDIKIMLTSMNKQINNVHGFYSKRLLKDYYKNHIDICKSELAKRGETYE